MMAMGGAATMVARHDIGVGKDSSAMVMAGDVSG